MEDLEAGQSRGQGQLQLYLPAGRPPVLPCDERGGELHGPVAQWPDQGAEQRLGTAGVVVRRVSADLGYDGPPVWRKDGLEPLEGGV